MERLRVVGLLKRPPAPFFLRLSGPFCAFLRDSLAFQVFYPVELWWINATGANLSSIGADHSMIQRVREVQCQGWWRKSATYFE